MSINKLNEDIESGATDMIESAINCQDADVLYESVGVLQRIYEYFVHLSTQINPETIDQLINLEFLI